MLPPLPCRPEKGLTFHRYPNPALRDAGRGKYNTQLKLTNIASFCCALLSIPVQHEGECPQVASAKIQNAAHRYYHSEAWTHLFHT